MTKNSPCVSAPANCSKAPSMHSSHRNPVAFAFMSTQHQTGLVLTEPTGMPSQHPIPHPTSCSPRGRLENKQEEVPG